MLVSDGYIGGEEEIVRTLVETMPDSCRLHFLGIGSAVNRSLALAMTRAGRGVECVVSTGDDPERALARLLRATTAPILTNLVLSGDALVEHAPKLLPDVFAESPLRIAVKVSPEGGCLVLHGETATGPWSGRIDLPATAAGDGDPGIVALFARECVADLETRRSFDAKERDLDRAIESLGVTFQIATLRTSWVAVDEVVSVDPESKKRLEDVPQELPHGTRIEGFGLRARAHMDDSEETDSDFADATLAPLAYSDDLRSVVEAPTLSGSESGQVAPQSARYFASPAMATSSRAPAKRRSPLMWVAVVLLILLLLAAISFFLTRGS